MTLSKIVLNKHVPLKNCIESTCPLKNCIEIDMSISKIVLKSTYLSQKLY